MRTVVRMMVALAILIIAPVGHAQTEATKAEYKAAAEEANKSLVHGPTRIDIRDQATLTLPAGDSFIPAAAAGRYLRAMGNTVDDNALVGLVIPSAPDGDWFAVVQFEKGGYVRDDDARDWKASDLLKSMQDATDQGNASRKERGIPEIEVTGWAEPPSYDAITHRLVWSSIVRTKGDTAGGNTAVNYRTLALGREGHLSLTMVTNLSALAKDKPVANSLLADIDYVDGKRYADFNSSTDHIAEYGLAALIVGVGAKKLGLLALAGVFIAKFFKIGLVAFVAFGAAIRRFLKRQRGSTPPQHAPTQQSMPARHEPDVASLTEPGEAITSDAGARRD
ncbi:DUF2167 domain-containing protein [Paraburkholderia hospita]|nr:DUF2167 domain-containing protein [Paraburkholderia hospita]AXF04860.1 DUF2167 domain-containing protein [Paraburkholderia hospita]SKC96651.1 Uncharacterized membrane-anchored protein [Burkholderia sp. CF099]